MLKDFRVIEIKHGNSLNEEIRAEVTEVLTTGYLWWKKTTTTVRPIRKVTTDYWYFADTGEYTPGLEVERLYRAWAAQVDERLN